jgi:hypothetical protein
MKKLLSEIITAWWSEVDTKLVNPKSEEAIKGLKLVLREDFGFDSDVIDYVVEMVRSTPTNFDLGGKTSGIDVGKNQTAVSAQLHPVWDDDEEEDDEDDVYNNNDGELSEWDVTLLDGLDELNEADQFTAIKNDTKNRTVFRSQQAKDAAIKAGTHSDVDSDTEDTPTDGTGEEESGEEETQQQQPDSGKTEFSDSDKDDMMTQLEKDKKKEKQAAKKVKKQSDDEPKDDTKDTSTVNKLNKELKGEQEKTSKMRDEGVAGAGGEAASQGESRFCNAVDTIDEKKFREENREAVDKKVSEFKDGKIDGKKRPDKEDTDVLEAVGFEKPYSDEAFEYLAGREVFAEKEFQRILDTPKPNVFTKASGFDGDKNAYMSWMRAAYDGALSTQHHLENDTKMDTSKGYQTIQSTTAIDNKVESNLEKKANDPNLSDEDRLYYQKELKSFQKFRKYHDTYVVGVDENGRDYIVSISNKKDSNLNDPQNNTTPAARFEVMKAEFGEETAKRVTDSIDNGIKKVTTVTDQTRKSSSQVEVDDDFATLAEAASPKRMKAMDNRATMVDKKTGKAPRYGNGRPQRGAEFSCYLEDKGVKDYDKMSRAEKLKAMQQFMGDDDWHKENETEVAYDPYSKIFIKVGEAMKGSRGYGKAFWEKNPEAEKAKQSNGAKQAEDIKRKEQESVKEAHQSVVKAITEADKEKGFPKDGKNGPNTQAYVGTVMSAMHYDTYIDMDDEDDDKILLQMGVRGAKASHIRNCLAKQSGYDLQNGSREGLKKHLREKSSVNAETGAIVIKSENEDGKPTSIATDTWRTAGTSQKVASGFGSDMKTCVKSNVDTDRKK